MGKKWTRPRSAALINTKTWVEADLLDERLKTYLDPKTDKIPVVDYISQRETEDSLDSSRGYSGCILSDGSQDAARLQEEMSRLRANSIMGVDWRKPTNDPRSFERNSLLTRTIDWEIRFNPKDKQMRKVLRKVGVYPITQLRGGSRVRILPDRGIGESGEIVKMVAITTRENIEYRREFPEPNSYGSTGKSIADLYQPIRMLAYHLNDMYRLPADN
ncbi:MAG: hypothetical protein HYS81_05390 [Candidatus Aenigmatarchaeota archaeon]|nr:MAG: hypothetical protein HYS81_05390 [Candidatus Aenigmarchaeota archaeon]